MTGGGTAVVRSEASNTLPESANALPTEDNKSTPTEVSQDEV